MLPPSLLRRMYLVVLCSLAICVLASCAGDRGPIIRVEVRHLPPATASLRVDPWLNGVPSFDMPSFDARPAERFTVGLHAEPQARGRLLISVGTLDAAGCMQASGDASVDLEEGQRLIEATVDVTPWEDIRCIHTSDLSLHIRNLEPASIWSTGRNRAGERVPIRITGWGFRPDLKVRIADIPQPSLRWVSPSEIAVDTPVLPPQNVAVPVVIAGATQSVSVDLAVVVPSVLLTVTPPDLALPAESFADVAVLDINGDSKPDAAVLTPQGELVLFTNALPAGLARKPGVLPLRPPGPAEAGALLAGDLNGDKQQDLVAVSVSGLYSALQDAQQGFVSAQAEPLLGAEDAVLADLDRDDRLDLLRAGPSGISIHRSQQSGRFLAAPALAIPEASSRVLAVDLNRDGLSDAVALGKSGEFLVISNQGSKFYVSQRLKLPAGCGQDFRGALQAGDIDGDGWQDVVSSGSGVVLYNELGVLSQRPILGLSPCFGGQSVAIFDPNSDYASELAWLTTADLVLIPNLGQRMLRGTEALTIAVPTSGTAALLGPRHLPKADLDGDGILDLLVRDHSLLTRLR